MSKYKLGEKVRIRPDLKHGHYGGCLANTLMANHAGEVVTVKSYGHHDNYFLIEENLSGCKPNWHWSDEMVEPVPTYKIGDRVVIEKSNIDHLFGSHKDNVGTIVDIDTRTGYEYKYHVKIDNAATLWCKVKCLVKESEEKKVFTKKDLKTGDVIVRRNGWVEIAIVELGMFVTKCGWNDMNDVMDDLTDCDHHSDDQYDIIKVYRPTKKYQCQFSDTAYTEGTLVYDRERDTKKLYNGKVVCIDNGANKGIHTVGKVYQFKDGQLTGDNGKRYPGTCGDKIYTFQDWADWTSSKFIEVVE